MCRHVQTAAGKRAYPYVLPAPCRALPNSGLRYDCYVALAEQVKSLWVLPVVMVGFGPVVCDRARVCGIVCVVT